MYPQYCNLCGKYRIQHRNKKCEPYKISTFNTATTIKAAAREKNKTLFEEVKDLDLIAKEFKVHKMCYQKFTLGCSSSSSISGSAASSNAEIENEPVYEKGNFNEVQNYIKDIVLEQGKVASMKTLHEIYGLGIGDTRYRSKLKKRIQSSFENQIYFLSSKNLNFAEVIVRSDYLEDAPHYDRNETIRNVAQMLKEDILEKFSNVSEPNWHT